MIPHAVVAAIIITWFITFFGCGFYTIMSESCERGVKVEPQPISSRRP